MGTITEHDIFHFAELLRVITDPTAATEALAEFQRAATEATAKEREALEKDFAEKTESLERRLAAVAKREATAAKTMEEAAAANTRYEEKYAELQRVYEKIQSNPASA